jgi:hypothetical protein
MGSEARRRLRVEFCRGASRPRGQLLSCVRLSQMVGCVTSATGAPQTCRRGRRMSIPSTAPAVREDLTFCEAFGCSHVSGL